MDNESRTRLRTALSTIDSSCRLVSLALDVLADCSIQCPNSIAIVRSDNLPGNLRRFSAMLDNCAAMLSRTITHELELTETEIKHLTQSFDAFIEQRPLPFEKASNAYKS